MIDGHGDDLHRYGGKVRVNFSTNIWQHADLSGLKRYLATRLDFVDSYPEPSPSALERKIAEKTGLDPSQVMVTAGVTDAIYTIARAMGAYRNAVFYPTFSEYADAANLVEGGEPYFVKDMNEAVAKCETVWLCNPNNPTGAVIDRDLLGGYIREFSEKDFVIDSAYSSYCDEPMPDAVSMAMLPNVIMLHSLTKECCVPGLRVGYVTAHESLIEQLRMFRMPWSVSAIASDGASYLLDNPPSIPVGMLLSESRRMQSALSEIVDVMPSKTNFFLCRLKSGSASELKEWLIDRHGFLIRDASNFTGLTSGHFRVAAQLPDENDKLIDALREWTRL